MGTLEKSQQNDSRKAHRAIGAMFFAIFGGAWIGYWSVRTFPNSIIVAVAIAVCTVAVFMLAFNQYQRYKGGLKAEKNSPIRRRAGRLFNIINAAQWVVIVVGANVLANINLGEWVIPFVILVIGLHFFPLAHVFSNPPHYITGSAMVLVAAIYPSLFPGGPSNPIGCLGAGLVLWASAIWAVRGTFNIQASESAIEDL
jgi:hypothetical protein